MIATPVIKIHPNNVCIYQQIYTDNGELYRGGNPGIRAKKIVNCHRLSVNSKKKLNRAIIYMCHLAVPKKVKGMRYAGDMVFKLNFITLTLASCQMHADNVIKQKCLIPFIDYIKKVWHVKRFVWKAERQRNGNIHFHLLVDKYIPYQVIKEKWNKYQNYLGYIDRYIANSKNNTAYDTLQAAYAGVNSTDIHSVRKITDLHKYLCKYMLKSGNSIKKRISARRNNIVKKYVKGSPSVSSGAKDYLKNYVNSGRIWSCSYDLCNITGAEDLNCNAYQRELDVLINSGYCYFKTESYYTYIGFDYKILKLYKCYNLINLLSEYLIVEFDLLNTT